jgi:hypothetical protein
MNKIIRYSLKTLALINTNDMNATTKASLGFYFTTLKLIYNKITLHYLEKRNEKQEKERVTPEFSGY